MKKSKIEAQLLKEYTVLSNILYQKQLILDANPFSSQQTGPEQLALTWSGKNASNSILFDNKKSCSELLDTIRPERQYTFLLYDKSIIQAEYQIKKDKIIKARLLFIKLQSKVWSFEELSEFADISNGIDEILSEDFGTPTIIRIDYDPENHIDGHHPASHCTLNNVKECRIPMKSIISLGQFVEFILKQFYNIELPYFEKASFDTTITKLESTMIHFDW